MVKVDGIELSKDEQLMAEEMGLEDYFEDENREEYQIKRYGRYWSVVDEEDKLVAIVLYKKGAEEIVRRLATGLK